MNNTERSILKQIYENEKISRKEIATNLNLSKTIVGKYINNFIKKNYLNEVLTHEGKIGKPKYNLFFNKNFKNILVIQLKGSEVTGAMGNFKGNIFEKRTIYLNRLSKENVLKSLFLLIESFLNFENIEIISIGIKGVVNNKEGVSLLSVYSNWENINLKNILEEKYKIFVLLNNGANLMALREKKIGIGKKFNNFIIFNIDDGVGAGIILDNKLYMGSKFEAGEIGNAPYNYSKDALICCCGNKGCVETYLANWQVINRVKKERNLFLTYEEIIQKANNGESYFRSLLFDLSKAISHGILWTEYLLNPEAIIITGKITETQDFFWQEVRRTLNNNLLNKRKHIELFLSKYDENSILEGALYLGLEYFFKI